jgi:GDPmannose 4,6-dehydratase
MYACNGILFNHESPLRGETFVTRKITRALARIVLGSKDCIYLGNLDAKRDWGHAKDYVKMQWLMLQQEKPDDFVIATGVQHSVRQFVEIAARQLGVTLTWEGSGVEEKGIVAAVDPGAGDKFKFVPEPGDVIIQIDPRYFRPAEVENLLGDPSKANRELGWKPCISFEELVREMVCYDMEEAKRDALCKQEGFKVCNFYE